MSEPKIVLSGQDILEKLVAHYRAPIRWGDAQRKLQAEGKLTGSPADIGLLMKTVAQTLQAEAEENIKATLFKWAWPVIQRAVTHGLPSWYQNQLVIDKFEAEGRKSA